MGLGSRSPASLAESLVRAMVAGDAAAVAALCDPDVVLRLWSHEGAEGVGSRDQVAARLAGEGWIDPELAIHHTALDAHQVVEYTVRAGPPGRRLDHNRCVILEVRGGRAKSIDQYQAVPLASGTPVHAIAPEPADDEALDQLLVEQLRAEIREVFLGGRSVHRLPDVTHGGFPRPDPLVNHVHSARFDDADADARIDAVIAWHRERGRGLTWRVSDFDRPADLAQRLERRGLSLEGSETIMALRLSELEPVAAVAGVTIEPLDGNDPEARDVALDINARAFEWSAERIAEVRPWWSGRLRTTAVPHTRLHYLARIDGDAVGFASMSLCRGAAQLTGAGVVPEARRRGAYTALLFARLIEARDRGYNVATISAVPASRDIVARHGFAARARIKRFVWRPDRV